MTGGSVRLLAALLSLLAARQGWAADNERSPSGKASLTESSLGGQIFPTLASSKLYNLTVANTVTDWNMAVQWVVLDSNSSMIGNRVFALTHLSIWRALYANDAESGPRADEEAVAAFAAHLVLSNTYPQYYYLFDALLRKQTANLTEADKQDALNVLLPCVLDLLRERIDDGTQQWLAYNPPANPQPGDFRTLPSPPGFLSVYAMLPQGVPQLSIARPFILPSPVKKADLVKAVPPPYTVPSLDYDVQYSIVKDMGFVNSTSRSKNESNLAYMWSDPYGGSSGLSAQWMRVALSTLPQDITLKQTAQLLAALSCAHFDVNVVVYNRKYKFQYWRPITAIQLGDPDHKPDPSWQAYLQSQNNPSYPSKLGALAGASAAILDCFYQSWNHTDTSFDIGTDVTLPYPDLMPIRSYASIKHAAYQASFTRVFTGQEFLFSINEGKEIGRQVGQYIMDNLKYLTDM